MSRDHLVLITPGFPDPALGDGLYFCPACNQVEGMLASFPGLASRVDVTRVAFPRPRRFVIDLVGEENQGLPILILGDERPAPADALRHGETRFVADARRILELLAERHGVPAPH